VCGSATEWDLAPPSARKTVFAEFGKDWHCSLSTATTGDNLSVVLAAFETMWDDLPVPGLVVVNGAQLKCSKLSSCATSQLVVTGGLACSEAEGQPIATVNDHVAGTNILPFPGDCLTTGEPCVPQTPTPWSPGESYALFSSLIPLVASSATLQCAAGRGIIAVADPGQSTFDVQPPDLDVSEEDGSLFGDLVDFVVGDDIRTVLDSDASPINRALAAASLFPAGKLLKLKRLGGLFRAEKKADDAVDAAKSIKKAEDAGGVAKKPPKLSPKFKPPTNPPRLPPEKIPEGWRVREKPSAPQYPNGYWKLEKPMKDGSWQPIDPSTMKPGGHPETHVEFPPPQG
jgi:hypothetical protein